MSINLLSVPNNFSIYNANNTKKVQKANVSFKGADESITPEKKPEQSSYNSSFIQVHPFYSFNMELLKDGYTMEEIRTSHIFQNIAVADIDFSNPKFLGAVFDGTITKSDIFSYSNKKVQDIQALQRAYTSLKEKYNTADVQQYVEQENEILASMNEYLQGVNPNHSSIKPCTYQRKILGVLAFVDKNNEPILQALLNDDNFNNICMESALIGTKLNGDAKYGLEVLRLAQKIGYEKEFSSALSVIIGEANKDNMDAIRKILFEQDVLIENGDFVSNGLMFFLRDNGGLCNLYAQSVDMTLNDVLSIIRSMQEDIDE